MTVVYDAAKGRSVVAPAAQLPPLLFKVRGRLRHPYALMEAEDKRGEFELTVMNSAGALQPAASFHQFMRVVLTDVVEAYKRKDRELRQEAEDGDDVWDDFETIDDFTRDVMLSVLPGLRVPWPLEGMFQGLGTWILNKLLKQVARRRRAAVMIRLAVSNVPRLAGVSHLFEEFLPMIGVVPTVKNLNGCLRSLSQGYRDSMECMEADPDDVDDYITKLRRDGNASGYLQYYESGAVRWSCAPPDGPHVDSSDSDDSDADY